MVVVVGGCCCLPRVVWRLDRPLCCLEVLLWLLLAWLVDGVVVVVVSLRCLHPLLLCARSLPGAVMPPAGLAWPPAAAQCLRHTKTSACRRFPPPYPALLGRLHGGPGSDIGYGLLLVECCLGVSVLPWEQVAVALLLLGSWWCPVVAGSPR